MFDLDDEALFMGFCEGFGLKAEVKISQFVSENQRRLNFYDEAGKIVFF